ncbi:hypothetical protein HDU93_004032 [Gonapodya sp. JEL0774]|nr:hypothetical protein HDU93_004032 [Gonapodya sp. JEL0774]
MDTGLLEQAAMEAEMARISSNTRKAYDGASLRFLNALGDVNGIERLRDRDARHHFNPEQHTDSETARFVANYILHRCHPDMGGFKVRVPRDRAAIRDLYGSFGPKWRGAWTVNEDGRVFGCPTESEEVSRQIEVINGMWKRNGYVPEQEKELRWSQVASLMELVRVNPSLEFLQLAALVAIMFDLLLRAQECLDLSFEDLSTSGGAAVHTSIEPPPKPSSWSAHAITLIYVRELRRVGIKSGPMFPWIEGKHVTAGRKLTQFPFLLRLRAALTAIGVCDVLCYGTHSMRRGGAQYPLAAGYSLEHVRERGGWTHDSPEFLRYVVNWKNKSGTMSEAVEEGRGMTFLTPISMSIDAADTTRSTARPRKGVARVRGVGVGVDATKARNSLDRRPFEFVEEGCEDGGAGGSATAPSRSPQSLLTTVTTWVATGNPTPVIASVYNIPDDDPVDTAENAEAVVASEVSEWDERREAEWERVEAVAWVGDARFALFEDEELELRSCLDKDFAEDAGVERRAAVISVLTLLKLYEVCAVNSTKLVYAAKVYTLILFMTITASRAGTTPTVKIENLVIGLLDSVDKLPEWIKVAFGAHMKQPSTYEELVVWTAAHFPELCPVITIMNPVAITGRRSGPLFPAHARARYADRLHEIAARLDGLS